MLIRSVLGGALLVGTGLWWGMEMVQRRKRNRMALEETVRLLQQILDAVRYRKLPADAILSQLQQEKNCFYTLSECSRLQNIRPPSVLSAEQAIQFTTCMRNFGRQGGQSQCNQLERTISYFQECEQKMHEKECAAVSIFPKVGLCIGAMAALALL